MLAEHPFIPERRSPAVQDQALPWTRGEANRELAGRGCGYLARLPPILSRYWKKAEPRFVRFVALRRP